jgi:predicted kinase
MTQAYEQRTLVFLADLPGTGKPTLARALAHHLSWPVLDKDTIHTTLLMSGLDQAQAAPLSYEILFALSEDLLLQQRLSVIIDTADRQIRALERAVQLTQISGAGLKIIRCVAPASVRALRLAERIERPSQWKVDKATDEDQETWYAHLPTNTLTLQTEEALEKNISLALSFLNTDKQDK